MILKAERIAELLRKGEHQGGDDPLAIIPSPNIDDLEKSGAASVDMRLGTWFLTLRPARMTHHSINEQGAEAQMTKTHYVPFGSAYVLHPRNFVLGVTLEWIRMPKTYAAYVVGKSSWGRRGLIIATAVGVHPGFQGCLTLELSNVGEIPVEIHPGMPICQLCLHRAEESGTDHVDRSRFIGFRRPILGSIGFDDLARRLAAATAGGQ